MMKAHNWYIVNLLSGLCSIISFGSEAQVPRLNDAEKEMQLARQLVEEGIVLTSKGSYQEAIITIEKALQLYSNNSHWEDAVHCTIRLSQLADNFDAPDKKLKYANLALKFSGQYLPANHPLNASAFRQKAEAFMRIEVLDSANYFLTKAIALFKENDEWVDLGWSEILMSVNYYYDAKLDSFELHLNKVAQLLELYELPNEDKIELQNSLLSLSGILYDRQGDYDKAIANTQKALAITLNDPVLSTSDSVYIFDYYNNLGAYYLIKGDYERALDHFIQVFNLNKNASKDYILLNNIGDLFNNKKNSREAIRYYKRSFLLTNGRDNLHAVQMHSLNSLGIAYRDLGILDSALFYCQKVIDIPLKHKKYITWALLADISIKKNHQAKAFEQLDTALRLYAEDSTAARINPFISARLFGLKGDAYMLNQNTAIALKYYQKALIAVHSNFKDSIDINANPSLTGIYEPIYFLQAIHAKAKTQASFTNEPDQQKAALSTYQLTIQWIDSLQASYNSEASQLDWSSEFKPIYEEAIHVSYQLYNSTKNPKYLDLAFSFSEKSKNAILLETLKSNEGKSQGDVPDSLIQKEKDLNIDIAFYEKVLQKAKEEKDAAKEKLYQQYHAKSRLELVALREQMERDYPKFHDWKYGGQITTITETQTNLVNDQTAILEYFLGDSTAFVFVITKTSATLLPLTSPTEIKKAVADFRKELLDVSTFKRNAKAAFTNYQEKASDLYQVILEAPLMTLPAEIQQLIIVPDGSINLVPFEALCKTEKIAPNFDFALLPYVVYDFKIHYAYSVELLLKNKNQLTRLPANTTCLAFAPPYKGSKEITQRGSLEQLRSNSAQLEGTANEIKAISKFITGEFDFGATATEHQFKSLADQFGILHLAMHGVVDLDNSNFNHLKFSDLTKDSIEDNLLHHYEIANMTLQAQLVVLSACETGVGKYEEGEGVFSLARSFMYAGVPSVVMSLWTVNDASTSQLMPYFYKSLTDGNSKDGALQDAKLRFLKEADIEYRHPFYWSAFVVMGDAEQLKKAASRLVWWGGLGVLIMGLMGWWFWRRN